MDTSTQTPQTDESLDLSTKQDVEKVEVSTPQKYKVKIDGQELELPPEELIKGYQLNQASQKRFQEASQLKQQADQQMEMLQFAKSNPIEFFRATGLNAKSFAEQVLLQELEESMLSPEEKELRDLKQWKSNYEMQLAKQQEEQQQAQYSLLEEQTAQELESEILEVLSANNMKPTPKNIARVAEYLLASIDDSTGHRMHAKDAIPRLLQEQRQLVQEHISTLSPAEIEQNFPEFYKSLLKHSAQKSQAQLPQSNPKPVSKTTHKPETFNDFWKQIKGN